MTGADRARWDERYCSASPSEAALPERFASFADAFASATTAFEIACGSGGFAVWLAQQGVQVTACDVSPVAIERSRALAEQHGVSDRCSFVVADLDDGLPAGPSADLVICNMFRDPQLDQALIARLAPNGLLVVAALSEVGAAAGRFRAKPGELIEAFSSLEVTASEEADGVAWLVARPADPPA